MNFYLCNVDQTRELSKLDLFRYIAITWKGHLLFPKYKLSFLLHSAPRINSIRVANDWMPCPFQRQIDPFRALRWCELQRITIDYLWYFAIEKSDEAPKYNCHISVGMFKDVFSLASRTIRLNKPWQLDAEVPMNYCCCPMADSSAFRHLSLAVFSMNSALSHASSPMHTNDLTDKLLLLVYGLSE